MTEWHEIVRGWAAVFISAGLLLWTIFWSRRTVARSEQGELVARLAKVEDQIKLDERLDTQSFQKLESRLQNVEGELKHLPTREQFHAVQMSISEMKADFRELAAQIRPLAASVERIDDFLMDRANRS